MHVYLFGRLNTLYKKIHQGSSRTNVLNVLHSIGSAQLLVIRSPLQCTCLEVAYFVLYRTFIEKRFDYTIQL